MSTWKGARNSYSNGSCRVTWTLSAPRPGHAMDWRLAMSAGRRLGASKAGSGWTGSRGARGLQKVIARLDVPLAAGPEVAILARLVISNLRSLGFLLGSAATRLVV